MALTGAALRAALAAVGAVGNQIRSLDDLAAGANDALRQAPPGLTPAGAAAFLATCAVESAWWRTTTEYGSGPYAPYIGRTFVQLTWSTAYAGFGQWCHDHGLVTDPQMFVHNPTALSDIAWAWLGPVYYFEAHGLWTYGNRGDFLAVSQAVNGGDGRIGTGFIPNSWAERQAMYRVFLTVGADLIDGLAEEDIVNDDDIAKIAAATVQKIADYPVYDYTQPNKTLPWAISAAWGTTHAAYARSAAEAAATSIAALQATVNTLSDALAQQQGLDPAALRAAIADAIAATVTVTGELTVAAT